MTDNEIIKEIQGIKESMKRHIDLTNEMGQDLLRIDEEYTGGSKVWLTTDFFKKVVKHFCHSNYLVKCLEYCLDLINRLQAENERLKKDKENLAISFANAVGQKMTAKSEAYKECIERVYKFICDTQNWGVLHREFLENGECYWLKQKLDNLLKDLVGENK